MEKRKDTLSAFRACRFCLSQDGSLKNLHEKIQIPKNSVPFALKVLACIAVEIFPSDRMPPHVCSRCKFFMELFYEFKQICRRADASILSYLQTGTPLEPISWPSSLVKLFRQGVKPKVVKTVVEGGATVEVTSQDASDSEEDDENVYNVKIGDGDEDSACIKVVEGKEQNIKSKPKRGSDSEEDLSPFELEQEDRQQARGLTDGCWACNHCHRTFPLQQLLELHIVSKHRARTVSCDQCDAKFFTKYDLATHQLRHSDETPFKCSGCDRFFKRQSLLKRHEKIMHSDLLHEKCPHCPATFLSTEELEAHQQKHSNTGDRPFPCSLCDKRFRLNCTLDRHLAVVHRNRREFSCEYCPERFSTVSKLTRHVRSHAGERPYPCKYCDKAFTKSHHYTRHVRVKHPNQEPSIELEQYPCEQCSDTFANQDELIYHSAVHATQNLTCPLCQEKFQNVDGVTAHIKSHINGVEFMCDFCELVFTSKEKLENHVIAAHDEEFRSTQVSMEPDDSSMDMDDEEDEEGNGINVKEEGDHIAIEIKKPEGFMLPVHAEQEEKMDTTNSEDSDTEATLPELPTTNPLPPTRKSPPKTVPAKLEAMETATSKPIEVKTVKGTASQLANILKKAEEIKRKAAETLGATAKKDKNTKVESSSCGGASDKSLRLLEKELQELKRTNSTRSESTKTPAKAMETLRNRRPQLHTSASKLRLIDERKTPSIKSPAIEKKASERRAVKENKEPREKEKPNNGNVKEDRDVKNKEDKESKVKEDKEPKAMKEETVKDKQGAVKNGGNDRNNSEDGIRRSSRPSKIKDYAKMIRDRIEPDSDETEDDDEEYVETDKPESRPKTRRTSLKQKPTKPAPTAAASSAAATTASAEKPTPRKRGRPRKEPQDIPAKLKKEETEEETESQPENETDNSTVAEAKSPVEPETETKHDKQAEKIEEAGHADTTKEQPIEEKKPEATTPPGPTLKKVSMKALPPGVKPLPLPLNARPGELCQMQIGQKMVKVQKIIMPKAAVEDMQKKGYLEMKGGTMVLKPGIKLDQKGAIVPPEAGKDVKESPKPTPTRCPDDDA
ncbi:RE1-silencing transcription factor-like isoform X2 [Hyposmocoma kahamanoa]|uniref:RE1-silencing transcription factor-like isoform X2 n=1 Tax=Hyposmocoma kahamanoa TaxID=1477025 RepID=UPI000E6D60C6|nr:RE1-silencing transcription factor-like isoform X2 [Hyposmocoma kahamanoa]